MVDLNESPGVWHGIAEGHHWLSDKERLELALKACDLYLKRIDELEQEPAADPALRSVVIDGITWSTGDCGLDDRGRFFNVENTVTASGQSTVLFIFHQRTTWGEYTPAGPLIKLVREA